MRSYVLRACRSSRCLAWCLAIGWCFVAPKMAWGEARRGSISAAICDRGATKPQAIFGATLRAAGLFPGGETPANCETPHQAVAIQQRVAAASVYQRFECGAE